MAQKAPGKYYRNGMTWKALFRMFPDDETAEKWFVRTRWPNGVACPECGSVNVLVVKTRKPQPFRCRDCRKCFSVRTETLMQGSNLGLQTWAVALYVLTTGLKGTSSMKLHRDLGVTQKTAWHLAHRIRDTWRHHNNHSPTDGPVEADETFIGSRGKTAVAGVKDRATGRVKASVVPDTTGRDAARLRGRARAARPLRGSDRMKRPKLLDLFCCAGGAARGYHDAGFDVVGVDIDSQPRYPYEFIRADVIALDASFIESFDAVHASPPCQAYSDLAKRNGNGHMWPKLIEPVRDMLAATGKPYVIENVEGAPLQDYIVLCGTMFDNLRVIRHRLFEANFPIEPPNHKPHPLVHTFDRRKAHFGKTDERKDYVQVTGGGNCTLAAAHDAMGIDWKMMKREINEAIPPAYAEFVGREMMRNVLGDGETGS